jgi:hypothetical protein
LRLLGLVLLAGRLSHAYGVSQPRDTFVSRVPATSAMGQQRHFGNVRATSAFLPDSGQLSEKADIYI